jgi:hypothetical protein
MIERGDWLTFKSIGWAVVGSPTHTFESWADCEIDYGVFRRHPELRVSESRSDISRDGYIGVLFALAAGRNNRTLWGRALLQRILRAGWRRGWTMGNRGEFDYINIGPLVPWILMLRYGRWVPTPKLTWLVRGKWATGYRAHLWVMLILIDLCAGKSWYKHESAIGRLRVANPHNRLFRIMNLDGDHQLHDDNYEWGGCTPDIFNGLCRFTQKLIDKLVVDGLL